MLDNFLGILMVFGPVLGYIDQIIKFRTMKSSFGFSLDTPGILLISSIIRVFFWIGKRFDIILLYQSIVMIIVQTWLLYECIRYRSPTLSIHNRKRWFWNWRSFMPYMTCLIVLLGHLIFFFNFFGDQVWFIELLGYLALGIESTLPMPQALQNYKNQSVSGFSPFILLTWFIGDSFKIYYYVFYSETSPLQFALCSAIQLLVDSIIVVQFIAYDDKNNKK